MTFNFSQLIVNFPLKEFRTGNFDLSVEVESNEDTNKLALLKQICPGMKVEDLTVHSSIYSFDKYNFEDLF